MNDLELLLQKEYKKGVQDGINLMKEKITETGNTGMPVEIEGCSWFVQPFNSELYLERYFIGLLRQREGGHTFNALTDNQKEIEKRNYNDISYVNYWIDTQGKKIYKIHMKTGEAVDLQDNSDFQEKYCPVGINFMNGVSQREYL